MKQKPKAFLLYLPVLQQGYVDWIEDNTDTNTAFIVDSDVIKQVSHLRKDIRSLKPAVSAKALKATTHIKNISVISSAQLDAQASKWHFLMPDDDMSAHLLETSLKGSSHTKAPVFLQWNRQNVHANVEIEADSTVQYAELNQDIREALESEAKKSTDWWRRVSSLVVDKDTIVFKSANLHKPTQYTALIDGDMRMSLNRGSGIELIGTEHAEAATLAFAASQGVATKGMDIYVTTFPCPVCAKFIASAGISRVFFMEGYATGNGLDALKLKDVEIIQIKNYPPSIPTEDKRPYPERSK